MSIKNRIDEYLNEEAKFVVKGTAWGKRNEVISEPMSKKNCQQLIDGLKAQMKDAVAPYKTMFKDLKVVPAKSKEEADLGIKEERVDEKYAVRKMGWDKAELSDEGYVTLNDGTVHDIDDAIQALKMIKKDLTKMGNDPDIYVDKRGVQRRKKKR